MSFQNRSLVTITKDNGIMKRSIEIWQKVPRCSKRMHVKFLVKNFEKFSHWVPLLLTIVFVETVNHEKFSHTHTHTLGPSAPLGVSDLVRIGSAQKNNSLVRRFCHFAGNTKMMGNWQNLIFKKKDKKQKQNSKCSKHKIRMGTSCNLFDCSDILDQIFFLWQ